MKKFFYTLFAILAFVACSESDVDNGGNNGGGQTPPKQPEITLSTAAADFSTDGGSNVITFTSSEAWSAEVVNSRADDWCSIEPTSGPAGSVKITVTTTENDTPDDRTASIIIKAGTASKTINVSQKQKDALTVTSSKFEVSAEGGEVSIEVKANIDFEYTIEESAADWVEYKATRALKTSNLVFEVKENDDTDKREAKIVISGDDMEEVVTIYQEGSEPSIILTENEFTVSSSAETIAVEVKSNVDVAVEIPNDVKWITENATRAFSTNTYYFDVAENDNISGRSAEIKFTNEENGISEKVTINQGNKAFAIKQKEYILPLEGSRILVEIEYTKPYKILKKPLGTAPPGDNDVVRGNGIDRLIFGIPNTNTETEKEIIISDEDEKEIDTIRIIQRETSEQLHYGSGNTYIGMGCIVPYNYGHAEFDIYTNLDDYNIIIFGNTDTHQAKFVRKEKTDFGFKEYYELPENNTEESIHFNFAHVGPNITYVSGATIRPKLIVNFEEDDEMYISQDGGTFTTHASVNDDNLGIRLEGDDTSWLQVKDTEDTYTSISDYDGIRRINTTFVASPNSTGKTREISIVAYGSWGSSDVVKVIQPSGESVLLSNSVMYVGAWEDSYDLLLKKCDYSIDIEGQPSWLTLGVATEKTGAIAIPINVASYSGATERDANIIVKSGNITNKVYIQQFPESGALIDDSDPKWKAFTLPEVKFETPYPNSRGSLLYLAIVEDPKELIAIQSRRVLDLLYFSPDDPMIPRRGEIVYKLDNYDGISAFYSGGNGSGIVLSNQYIESYYNQHGAKALVAENKGVLSHELTHSFQLSPQGVGDYSNRIYHACIEGMADAVRVLSGGFPNPSDRPRGGSYLDSYRYTGFFIAWLVQNKDKDFLRKFNMSTQHVIPWSFDGAIKYALGDKYNVDDLWLEYQRAMGDIK